MNNSSPALKIVVGVLAIGVVVLAVLVINSHQQAAEQAKTVIVLSNQVEQVTVELTDNKQTITNLEADLTARQNDILSISNLLANTQTNLDETQASLKSTQDELAKRNDAFAKLNAHDKALQAHTAELDSMIASLKSKIDDVSQKLTAAEGDKAALSAELKRLTAEKDELQHEFNDLGSLRAQVKKIKSDNAVAQRLDWKKAGIQTAEPKGAEKQTGTGAAASTSGNKAHYDLNVEVNSDGSVRTIPPLNTGK